MQRMRETWERLQAEWKTGRSVQTPAARPQETVGLEPSQDPWSKHDPWMKGPRPAEGAPTPGVHVGRRVAAPGSLGEGGPIHFPGPRCHSYVTCLEAGAYQRCVSCRESGAHQRGRGFFLSSQGISSPQRESKC